ncbi:MAG: hypothetical protein DHS20C11_36240 [Lysobacteraceae bacterium]|nr:MAG: hypothetical protein DHS20C11_36240 [Xanthomonadaceae bacterium]
MSSARAQWLLLIVIAIVAGVAGWGIGRWLAAPQMADIAAERFPTVEWIDLEGTMHTSDDWQGSPTLVNFWATWCAPCRREMPYLDELHGNGAIEIVGVAIDTPGDVEAFLEETPVSYTILIDDGAAMSLLAFLGNPAGALPHSVLLDRHGAVVTTHMGELTEADFERMMAMIAEDA